MFWRHVTAQKAQDDLLELQPPPLPGNSPAAREAAMFFEKFASVSIYYNEVNKLCYNVCPAFYKFKIQPF